MTAKERERMAISDSIKYVGFDDAELEVFESQYPTEGISYNSYVILDEKIAVMDTADRRASEEWRNYIKTVLLGKAPDYQSIANTE